VHQIRTQERLQINPSQPAKLALVETYNGDPSWVETLVGEGEVQGGEKVLTFRLQNRKSETSKEERFSKGLDRSGELAWEQLLPSPLHA
jgi:hypothetical protein